MKKLSIVLSFWILVSIDVDAQQLPYTSPIQELSYLWNPGFTAQGTDLEYTAFYRKQWFGFDNAPNTAVASVQYPFIDLNMSVGGSIISDKTGPVSKTGVQLNYAYKLREIFSEDDQLSLGINAYLFQYSFSEKDQQIIHPDDPLLAGSTQSKFNPSAGFGLAYLSSTEEYRGDNVFYFGVATMQSFSTDLSLATGSATREQHIFANLGTKLYGYSHYIEPSFQVNFVNPEIIDYILSAKYEMEDTFWSGISYSSTNAISINGGVIMNDVGGRYTQLRIGALAGINGSLGTGPTFEFFLAYRSDLD